MRCRQLILISCLLGQIGIAQAVSIFPNRINLTGKAGTRANVQIKIYGHAENVTVEFIKSVDLTSLDDQILQTFELGREAQFIIPVDFVLTESKEFYLCAVLKKSESMRLRVCSAVRLTVSP